MEDIEDEDIAVVGQYLTANNDMLETWCEFNELSQWIDHYGGEPEYVVIDLNGQQIEKLSWSLNEAMCNAVSTAISDFRMLERPRVAADELPYFEMYTLDAFRAFTKAETCAKYGQEVTYFEYFA